MVLLDERGKDIGSERMAELVGDAGNTVRMISHLVFSRMIFRILPFLCIYVAEKKR